MQAQCFEGASVCQLLDDGMVGPCAIGVHEVD
jgi:hypothetical protein